MEISPIAHVALLQTEMNSGFRLVPNIGMKSAGKKKFFFNVYLTVVYYALKKTYQVETEMKTRNSNILKVLVNIYLKKLKEAISELSYEVDQET